MLISLMERLLAIVYQPEIFAIFYYYNHIQHLFICYEKTSSLSVGVSHSHKLLKSWALKQTLSNKETETFAFLKAQVFWGVTLLLGESLLTFRSIIMSSSNPNSPKRIDFSIVVVEHLWSFTFAPRVFFRSVCRDEFASPHFFLFYR